MNVLVLGARVIGPALADEPVQAFVAAKFSNEPRHVRRLEKSKRWKTAVEFCVLARPPDRAGRRMPKAAEKFRVDFPGGIA
jgi:hypothetical protein